MAASKTIQVELQERAYPIVIGENDDCAWSANLGRLVRDRQVAVISDLNVVDLYRARFEMCLKDAGARKQSWYALQAGEIAKTGLTCERLYDALLNDNFGRDGLICALGGGVVGDLAGFVAATLHRGVELVQLPTTLLAMVDSAIGGKTGINHPRGKNLIGAFYQPSAVLANLSLLASLDRREVCCGLAEVIKYGAAFDAGLFCCLEERPAINLSPVSEQLLEIVYKSAKIKTEVVQNDEREAGERIKLNFGHTIGHAIELAVGYGNWSHGAAVAVGMVEVTRFAERQGVSPAKLSQRIANLCAAFGLPTHLKSEQRLAVSKLVAHDKKMRGQEILLVLPVDLGEARVFSTEIGTFTEWLVQS